MGKAIGIDLGTTNSVVAFKDTAVKIIQTGLNNEDLCRSCVALDKSNQFLVGNAVFKNWKKYSPNIVVSVKRLMGAAFSDPQVQKMCNDKNAYPYGIKKPEGATDEAVAIVLKGKEYTPEQLSAEILKTLKKDADNKLGNVTHAVITVPAYFTEKQKNATKEAARLAGLHVQQLLAEPTAAAISYGIEPGQSKQVLVYDFGGGTFDLSIIMAADGQFIESGSGGDRWLGGDDIDRLLSDYVCKEIEKRDGFVLSELLNEKTDKEKAEFTAGLKAGVEECKKTLSQVEKATIFFSDFLENKDGDPVDDLVVSRTTFNSLITPLISRTIDLIEDLSAKTGIPMDTIDNILLVGGSSCIPLVKKMLTDKYGAKVLSSEKPMLAIAEGAAILAHDLPATEDGIETTTDHPVTDSIAIVTTKHQYFIQLVNPDGSTRMEKIIDYGEVLPFETRKQFHTSVDNQKIVEVKLFTDVEGGGYEKTASGFFTISENLPAMSNLNFKFSLDVNETMSADVKVVSTGKSTDIRLGRGYRDSSCLMSISSSIDEVLGAESSNSKKSAFLGEIQGVIDEINANNLSHDDSKWSELESKVRDAELRAQMTDPNDKVSLEAIFATILLKYFQRFISNADEAQMRDLLSKFKNTNDSFEKASLCQRLKSVTDRYSLFIYVFQFKIIADSSENPQIAGRAACVYDEIINALNYHNMDEVNNLIRANKDILENAGPIDPTGIGGIGIS